jgi:hypothetical protein
MRAQGDPVDFTPEELARVQTAIDSGTIWATFRSGKFAMRLIESGKCKLPPGVLEMWQEADGRYRPIYSKEELNELVRALLDALPGKIAAANEAKAEMTFFDEHKDELVGLYKEEMIKTVDPIVPALLAGGLGALVLFLLGLSLWLTIPVALIAYWIRWRRNQRLRVETLARRNALRARAGLPPVSVRELKAEARARG